MGESKLVYVKADEATQRREEARQRGRDAVRRLAEAEREYESAMVEVNQVLGPDPRALVAEQAIADFCAAVTRRPSIG